MPQRRASRRKGSKYGPLQKLLGVIATISPPEARSRAVTARKPAYRLLVSTPIARRNSRSRDSVRIFL